MSKRMNIGILGTGAMGLLLAAKLAPLADVIVLGTWVEGVDALNAHGVLLEENGEARHIPVRATVTPEHVAPVDLAIVAVKGHQTERAAGWVKTILKQDGVALTLQNGLGNLEILAAQVGSTRAAMGVTMQGATLLGPGHVKHAGNGLTTLAASPEMCLALEQVAAMFQFAGLETHLAENVESMLWGKLVVNSAINALSAIYRVPNGWLVEHAETRALLSQVAQETAQVAAALGITLPYADPVASALQVATNTAANKSSTLQDVLRGAPTELDRINGAVIREGKRVGVPTPLNEKLLRVMQNPRFTQRRAVPLSA